jgi:hypothetical protein
MLSFRGIDVSKDRLDVMVLPDEYSSSVPNDPASRSTAIPCRRRKLSTRCFWRRFVQVTDPVGAGFVDSLARPGGNATGFTLFEYGISGKWLSPCGCARSWYRARPLLHRARAGFEQQIGSIAGFVSVQPISLLLISGLHRIALIDRG